MIDIVTSLVVDGSMRDVGFFGWVKTCRADDAQEQAEKNCQQIFA